MPDARSGASGRARGPSPQLLGAMAWELRGGHALAYIDDTELGQYSAIPADVLAEIDATTRSQEREAGTSYINGYLASRYGDSLPITTPPREIKQANADLTAYWLMTRRGFAPKGGDELFRQRFEDTVAWLKDVARGSVTLDLGVSTVPRPHRFARATSRTPRGWDDVR